MCKCEDMSVSDCINQRGKCLTVCECVSVSDCINKRGEHVSMCECKCVSVLMGVMSV